MNKNILSIILLCLFGCNFHYSNFDKSLLPGYWITLDNSNLGTDKIIVDNDLYMILDSGIGIDSISFTYKLNNNIITIYKGSHWISKNKIIKLTTDTLIYKRVGDNVVSKYVRKIF